MHNDTFTVKDQINFQKFNVTYKELSDRKIQSISNKNAIRKQIYLNDVDNLYPNRIEIIERNSTTANACSQELAKFVIGKGIDAEFASDVFTKGGVKLNPTDCLEMIVEQSLRTHRGVYIHLNYDIDGNVNYFDVLNYIDWRKSKEDCYGFDGVFVKQDWCNVKNKFEIRKDADLFQFLYPYAPNLEVINKQRIADNPNTENVEQLIRGYRGQCLFFSLDAKNIYPYAWLTGHAVNDADSEFRLSIYRNNNIRNGFQDKNIVVTNGMDKKDADDFGEDIQNWMGAENAGSVMHLDISPPVDDIANYISNINIKSTYNSTKFKLDEEAFERNIRKCYLSIPKILIGDADGGIFGNSGELITQAKIYYSEKTEGVRSKLERLMERIFKQEFKIKPLIEEEQATVQPTPITE